MILASDPMTEILAEAGAQATTVHPNGSAMQLLELETADAAVFHGHDPRPDPAAGVTALNIKTPAGF
ncbi:hypothetical protein [Streptomyces sp. NPDC096351]|uniref:hypothetical protein n=1 Tax=Streptomyces sp. NPDC096351 TaxID=3366087 RepID=UPI00382659BA